MSEMDVAVDPLPKVWDPQARIGDMLRGKRGLIVGVANEKSIAFGCAAKLRGFGAELAITYLNEKAEPTLRPLAEQVAGELADAARRQADGRSKRCSRVFKRNGAGSISSFTPSPSRRAKTCTAAWSTARLGGFAQAMRVSCYSFIEMARLAEPLMTQGRRAAGDELLRRRQGRRITTISWAR